MSDQVCFEITVFMINAKAKSIRKGGYIYLAQLVLTCYFWDWGRNAVKRRPLFSFQQCLNRNSEIGEREIVRLSCVLVLSRVFVFAVLVLLLLLPAASFNAGGRMWRRTTFAPCVPCAARVHIPHTTTSVVIASSHSEGTVVKDRDPIPPMMVIVSVFSPSLLPTCCFVGESRSVLF